MTNATDEGYEWISARPDCVKKLMMEFPPSCRVRLKKHHKLCQNHADKRDEVLVVVSYNEDGKIGLAPSYERLEERRYFNPKDFDIVAFIDGQNHEWIKGILS